MAEINTRHTNRGFVLGKFDDAKGLQCSIQESSEIAAEGRLWLGVHDLKLQMFIPYGNPSWRAIDEKMLQQAFPEAREFFADTRMCLTQTMAQDLVPMLQYFAEHGTLPQPACKDSEA